MIRPLHDLGELGGVHVQLRERVRVVAQRVAGDVQAGHVLLKVQARAQAEIRDVGQRGIDLLEHAVAKERHLSDDVALAGAARAVERRLVHGHQLRARRARAVKRAGEDQRLDHALVDQIAREAFAEVEDVLERAGFLADLDDRVDRLVAAGADGAQAEADARLARGVPAHGELAAGLVDIRREQRDAVLAAVLRILRDLAAVVGDGVEQRGEELHRIVTLEPARAHGNHAVGRGVRLVERVGGKRRHLVKELAGDLRGDAVSHAARHGDHAVLDHAVDEVLALLDHHVVLLLAHGAAHEVASAVGIAGQIAHDLHDLLLIDHAAVGDVEDGLELRVQILNLLRIALALDVAGDGFHRAGAVERDGRDDVLKVLRAHVGEEGAHAARFQLEHAVRLAFGDHVVDRLVIQRDVLGLHIDPGLAHQVERVADDRERAQAQEVHL